MPQAIHRAMPWGTVKVNAPLQGAEWPHFFELGTKMLDVGNQRVGKSHWFAEGRMSRSDRVMLIHSLAGYHPFSPVEEASPYSYLQ